MGRVLGSGRVCGTWDRRADTAFLRPFYFPSIETYPSFCVFCSLPFLFTTCLLDYGAVENDTLSHHHPLLLLDLRLLLWLVKSFGGAEQIWDGMLD